MLCKHNYGMLLYIFFLGVRVRKIFGALVGHGCYCCVCVCVVVVVGFFVVVVFGGDGVVVF